MDQKRRLLRTRGASAGSNDELLSPARGGGGERDLTSYSVTDETEQQIWAAPQKAIDQVTERRFQAY